MIRKSILERYARSLAEVAVREQADAVVERNFRHLLAAVETVPDLGDILRHPAVSGRAKESLVAAIAERFAYHPRFTAFLRLLVRRHRAGNPALLFDLFLQARDRLAGVVAVTVTSARPLSDDRRAQLADSLAKGLGGRVALTVDTDPGLIGGLRVQVGSTVYDGTIRSLLDRLRVRMVS